MGSGSWDPGTYANYASTVKSARTAFTSTRMKSNLDPNGVAVRESRDSADNPLSTPLIVGIDVTGSMGKIAEKLAREGLGTLFTEVLDRKPITNPHVMFMAIGDAYSDRSPLQASQFEADSRIISQLSDIYLEGGGGGGGRESYNLAWYFAGYHTSHDSFEKRGKKGYLFTVGDEDCHPTITASKIREIFGDEATEDMSNAALLAMAQKYYHVFHLVVQQGSYGLDYLPKWREYLGQNALVLSDYTKLSEVIVSTMQVIEGESVDTVTKSWSGATSVAVATAIRDLAPVGAGKAVAVKRF